MLSDPCHTLGAALGARGLWCPLCPCCGAGQAPFPLLGWGQQPGQAVPAWGSWHGGDESGKVTQGQREQSHFCSAHPVSPNRVVSPTHSNMQPQLPLA